MHKIWVYGSNGKQGRTQDFKLEGPEISETKNSNSHPYSINKLSTKTNTQKSLFLNILRYNHLLTKTKDTKHYCFFIQLSMKRKLDALSNFQNHLRLNPNEMSKLYPFQCIISNSPSKIGIATLVVGNSTLTSEEFEVEPFLLKKIKHCSWFFHDLQIK